MELILLDKHMYELAPAQLNIDFEIGDTDARNDFEIEDAGLDAHGIYIPGTEWGGLIEYESGTTDSDTLTLKGWTWRGLLTQYIIEPPSGNDYKVVSGEANSVIRELLAVHGLDGIFAASASDSGLTVGDYQFKRFATLLEGITEMLGTYGYRLQIRADRKGAGEAVNVTIEAVPSTVVENTGEFNEDQGIVLNFTDDRMGINHLICLGKGELQARERIDLYVQADGSIGEDICYTGSAERTAVYENTGAEGADLAKYGKERLNGIAGGKTLTMSVSGLDLEIGDIIVARHRRRGLSMTSPVNRKILRILDGTETIEYKVKGAV